MAAGEIFFSMDGSLWIQPDGPNTDLFFLGCHMLGDVARPRGDNTQVFCPDPSGPGRYTQVAKIKGPPGLITLSVETDVRSVKDYLEGLGCPASLIVTQTKKGKKDRVTNWLRAFIIPGFDPTTETYGNLVGKDSNDRSTFSVDANADDVITVLPLKTYRQSTSETHAINSIFSCDEELCQTPTSVATKKCSTLFAVADAGAVVTAKVLYKDGDSAWAAMATAPFAANENINAGLCFQLDNDTTRVMVFRGLTGSSVAVNAMKGAYTDNNGATWTVVTIGSDVGEYVPTGRAVFALDSTHIWIGTDSGRIYFSGDGGVTWTIQENAVIQASAWNWVQFVDENTGWAGGAGDNIAVTVDGGSTWSVVTVTGGGGAILAGKAFSGNQAWVADSTGDIYFTNDGGVTWTLRTFPSSGTGQVTDMAWANQFVGIIAWKSGANLTTFYFTKDGGRNWEEIPTTTNTGINRVFMCDPQLAYAAGEVTSGTGTIFKLNPI